MVHVNKKIGLNWTKIINIGTKLNIEHWLCTWHVGRLKRGHLKKIKIDKNKKFKKTTKWHVAVTVAVNDLNGISKKGTHWTKLTKIRIHKIKVRTYLTKLDENWDKKSILTFCFYLVIARGTYRFKHLKANFFFLLKPHLFLTFNKIYYYFCRCA